MVVNRLGNEELVVGLSQKEFDIVAFALMSIGKQKFIKKIRLDSKEENLCSEMIAKAIVEVKGDV